MTNRYILGMVMIGLHLAAIGQFKLAPITLAGVSTIHSLQLPSVAPFKIIAKQTNSATNGVGTVTNDVCVCPSTVLPVTLLELTGHRLNINEVVLNWKTENETNSKGFSIDRSLDDAATFLQVGTMASDTSTSTTKNYKKNDLNSYAKTSYYRIKQIDIDGAFTYSNIINVKGYDIAQRVALSPNPAFSYTLLSCFSTNNGSSMVTVLSANGQKLIQNTWALVTGSNTLRLSLAKLAAGMYYVQMAWPDGNNSVMKLVVQ